MSKFKGLVTKGGLSPATSKKKSATINSDARTAVQTAALARKHDPDYKQIAGFIPKGLHKDLRKKLIDSDTDLSTWLEEMARRWLAE